MEGAWLMPWNTVSFRFAEAPAWNSTKSRPCLSGIASPYLVWKGWLWYRHSADMGGEASDKKGDW
ncbi:MAG: hypothetical protein ACLT4H_18695 [Bacteroides thetaiotaomicron]